ncbi:hypothetical protein BDY17DRAFT_163090 [Neohortaea acidophila]|uniref:Uncharacterized protein n=1 Tax=Neohortaea acidophila TaxID=245834 RepID=A0A6A6PS71_9PEZI|nr:uncharacterized protein BDY17DRAFT_163090 [Neohortaea acidophila]KAF2482626.1 hypothetical protein BDY17DRAFT_163090 [Neohortaea acidophila]
MLPEGKLLNEKGKPSKVVLLTSLSFISTSSSRKNTGRTLLDFVESNRTVDEIPQHQAAYLGIARFIDTNGPLVSIPSAFGPHDHSSRCSSIMTRARSMPLFTANSFHLYLSIQRLGVSATSGVV